MRHVRRHSPSTHDTHGSWQRRRRPSWHRRGQALIESAFILPILLLLVTGATDVSQLLNDHLNIVYAARQGARTGSVLGSTANADCVIIGAVHAALANEPSVSLQQIIIYKAGADGLPTTTQTGGSTLAEDVYPGNTVCTYNAATGTATTSQSPNPNNWPPTSRSTKPFYEDSLGVELDFTYTYQFQLIGAGTVQASDHAVMPVEIGGLTPPGGSAGPPHHKGGG